MGPFFSLSVALCLAISCVHSGSQSDALVVEKSKEEAPAWLDLPRRKLQQGDVFLRFVDTKEGFLDLPLGIKESQLNALKGSEEAIAFVIAQNIADLTRASAEQISSVEFKAKLAASTGRVHGKYARIADIYFEKIQLLNSQPKSEPQEFYNAHVLIQFPKVHLLEFYQDVAKELTSSKSFEIRTLGEDLRHRLTSQAITH